MRTLLLCCALLLTAVPVASAHDGPPNISTDPDPCEELLPLHDFATCMADAFAPGPHVPWAVQAIAEYMAHQADCHVVGGPACVV